MEDNNEITSVQTLLDTIKKKTKEWYGDDRSKKPWFRGHRDFEYQLLPKVLRKTPDGKKYNEKELTLMFRNRAGIYENMPNRSGDIDKWLFIMQHNEAPTRLLDWTENPLIALFFCLYTRMETEYKKDKDAALWMLNPYALNDFSIGKPDFPNTWSDHAGNIVRQSFFIPVGTAKYACLFPIAIQASYCQDIMSTQKSCFTIHGKTEEPIETICRGLIDNKYLIKYKIHRCIFEHIAEELDWF